MQENPELWNANIQTAYYINTLRVLHPRQPDTLRHEVPVDDIKQICEEGGLYFHDFQDKLIAVLAELCKRDVAKYNEEMERKKRELEARYSNRRGV